MPVSLLLQQMGIDKNDIPEHTQVHPAVDQKGSVLVFLPVYIVHSSSFWHDNGMVFISITCCMIGSCLKTKSC